MVAKRHTPWAKAQRYFEVVGRPKAEALGYLEAGVKN
jgi:hypothetical protein